jgi:hypothetical protein
VGFRKSKDVGLEKKRWHSFCDENRGLIESIGLPSPVFESQERFDDLLMHGYLDHHYDPTRFIVSELDARRFEKFKMLVDRYFGAGYSDPGLMVVGHEERLRLAKKYPAQFHESLRGGERWDEGHT